jgi:hypothetical protein
MTTPDVQLPTVEGLPLPVDDIQTELPKDSKIPTILKGTAR